MIRYYVFNAQQTNLFSLQIILRTTQYLHEDNKQVIIALVKSLTTPQLLDHCEINL